MFGRNVSTASQEVRRNTWIGNGVLDSFLEDESLFGEFLRAPVSEGGVEPLVVGPPHVVVEVTPQLLDRGVVVPVHELLLQQLCFVKFLWAVSAFLLVRLSGCF